MSSYQKKYNPNIAYYNGFPYNKNNPHVPRYISQNIFQLFNSIHQQEILENLWLGCSKSHIFFHFFDFTINMAADLKIIADINEKIYDNPTYNNGMYNCFDRITSVIHDKLTQNKRTLVFCYQGVSRSATMVAAYLIKYHSMNKNQAIQFIRNRRPWSLSADIIFDDALNKWEKLYSDTSPVTHLPPSPVYVPPPPPVPIYVPPPPPVPVYVVPVYMPPPPVPVYVPPPPVPVYVPPPPLPVYVPPPPPLPVFVPPPPPLPVYVPPPLIEDDILIDVYESSSNEKNKKSWVQNTKNNLKKIFNKK